MLQRDVQYLKARYAQDAAGKSEGRLVIRCVYLPTLPPPLLAYSVTLNCRSEKASKTYTTEVITNVFAEEGKELFDSRLVALGHTLQGGVPSPRDRTRAVRLTVKCIDFLEEHFNHSLVEKKRGVEGQAREDVASICTEGAGLRFVGLEEMINAADFKERRGKTAWWRDLKGLIDTMAGR